jgi:STE24 endopeptidase
MRTIVLLIFLAAFSIVIFPSLSQENSNHGGLVDSTRTLNPVTSKEKLDPYEATEKYMKTLSREQQAKSDSYYEGGYWLILVDFMVSVLVALLFLPLRLSSWIKAKVCLIKHVNLRNYVYSIVYLGLVYIFTFPFTYYSKFYREHQYNLSNFTFSEWLGEQVIEQLLTLIFLSLILTLVYLTIRKAKKYWWIFASSICILFVLVFLFLGPVLIFPLFNEYKALPAGPVRKEIISMAQKNNVPATDVYLVDESKQENQC